MRGHIVAILGALLILSCGSPQESPRSAAPPPEEPAPHGQHAHQHRGGKAAGACPMAVAGTTARTEDVEGGAAVVFTTTGDVAELRRRVARMATMHGPMGAHVSSSARSEDVEGGVRLVLTPRDPGDLAQLREHVRQHAEHMASGRCPMMSMHEGHSGAHHGHSETQ